jgi:hypothetical protein
MMLRYLIPLFFASLLAGAELGTPAWLDQLRPALNETGLNDLLRVQTAARGELDLELDDALPGLRGSMRLLWTNPGPDAVSDIVFNCWPNAPAFRGANLALTGVRVDGVAQDAESLGGGEHMRLVLPHPLPPGGQVLVEGQIAARISASGYHGLMTRSEDQVWVFSSFAPEVSVRLDGACRVDPLAGMADSVRTHIAHWLLRLRVPSGVVVAGPGSETSRRDLGGGRSEIVLAAPLTRNLCLVIGSGLVISQRETDGIHVRMWHRPERKQAGERAVKACAIALHRCAAAFGNYPWKEFDAVEAPLEGGVGGVEASGLVLIGLPPSGIATRMLEEICTHETCHQWWHLMVGNDTMRSPWLDESLTNWAGAWVLESEYGPTIGSVWSLSLFTAMMDQSRPPLAMTLPAGDYTETAYGAVVYGRGALMYQHLRNQLGSEKFLTAVREWTESHRFGWAEPGDWDAWLDRHAPPALALMIRQRWLSGQGLTQADLIGASAGR